MDTLYWFLLFGLAFMAAVFISRGRAGVFALAFIVIAFMVSVIYWTVLALPLLSPAATS